MFDEIKEVLQENQNISPLLKMIILIISRILVWLVWVFIGVGILLSKEYFQYWFLFMLLVITAFIALFIYSLLKVIQIEFHNLTKEKISDEEAKIAKTRNVVIKAAINGIIGSAAFYFVILLVFVLFKTMGVFDRILSKIIGFLK